MVLRLACQLKSSPIFGVRKLLNSGVQVFVRTFVKRMNRRLIGARLKYCPKLGI
jgi:hypothetical protein